MIANYHYPYRAFSLTRIRKEHFFFDHSGGKQMLPGL